MSPIRGGARAGKIGKAYTNRTDLAAKTKLPVTVGPSQYYGQATASANAQKLVPEGNPPVAPPANGGSVPTANTGWQPGQPPPLATALAANPINPLHAPTQRPNEPVTTGPLPPALPSTTVSVLSALNRLPAAQDTGQTAALRAALAASQANAIPQ